ncbi:hypothetical protein C1I98_37150 [Spongiactinospora gelatinilytica]|uniref:Integrase catalytic domain-containing protein n=1 Tax=Spongiactinospora gelatinilytica TaxID=2666298 RepID=A0A2W2F6P4_9ACTN|nr:hypothetical protein C1I98_37150 [Spongiactinospora gelatinilytica]
MPAGDRSISEVAKDFDLTETARSAIFEFIEGRYNLHRLHSGLGYRSRPGQHASARTPGA